MLMRQRAVLAVLFAASFAALGWAEPTAAGAARSPTTANVNLRTTLGQYAVAVTATKAATGRRAATLVVYLSRGDPSRDQQTHSYAFTLAPGAVAVDARLDTARIRARLGSFGAVDLTLAGRRKPSVERPSAPCSGPATISRSARVRGRIRLRLGSLGTLRRAGRSVTLDRLQRRGTVKCPDLTCRRTAGAQIAGINAGDNYLSIQSDGAGHTYVFATVAQRLRRPRVSMDHTRFALGGSLVASPGAGPDDRSIALTGGGPATGSLTFSGTGAPQADAGCRGHNVRRIFGPVAGRLQLPIDGVGMVSIAADGSATAPVGAYREQID